MQANTSVFNSDVSYPKGPTLPFDVIPSHYRDWYEATFDRGEREPPPTGSRPIAWRAPKRQKVETGVLQLELLVETDDEVLAVFGFAPGAYQHGSPLAVITPEGVLIQNRLRPCAPDALVTWAAARRTPAQSVGLRIDKLGAPLAVGVRRGQLVVRDLDADKLLDVSCAAESVVLSDRSVYAHAGDQILLLDFIVTQNGTRLAPQVVGNAHPRTTKAYSGCFMQNLLGVHYVTLLPGGGTCHQIPLPELKNYRVVDAAYDNHVLMVVATDAKGGYDRFVFRFNKAFDTHDVRRVEDITYAGLNFVSLDKGIVVAIDEEDRLEVFPVTVGADAMKLIGDPSVQGRRALYRQGDRVLMARDNCLYRVSLK